MKQNILQPFITKTRIYLLGLCFLFIIPINSLHAWGKNMDSLITALNKEKDIKQKNKIWNILIDEYLNNDLKSGIAAAKKKLAFNQKESYAEGVMESYTRLINAYSNASDFDTVHMYNLLLLKQATTAKDTYYIASYYFSEARIGLETSEFPKALDNLYTCLHFSEGRAGSSYLGMCGVAYDNLSLIYGNIAINENNIEQPDSQDRNQTFKKCTLYGRKALTIFKQLGNTFMTAQELANLGVFHKEFGNADSAMYYYRKALKIHQELNNSSGIAWLDFEMGRILADQQKCTAALNHFRKSLAVKQQMEEKRSIAETYIFIADIYRNCQINYDSAIIYFKKIITLIGDDPDLGESRLTAYRELSGIFESQGKFKAALQYYKLYTGAKDTILNETKTKQIKELETKYESGKQAATIQQLKGEKELATLRLKKNHAIMYSLIALVGLCITLLIIFLQRARSQKQKARIIQQELLSRLRSEELKSINAILENREEERKRIAYELHDRLGVMLATAGMYLDNHMTSGNGTQESTNIEKAYHLVNDAAQESRRVSQELSAPVLEKFGLYAALRELAMNINEAGKIIIRLDITQIKDIPSWKEVHIYRILQELISNTIRHSKAKHIFISLKDSDPGISVRYEDDGIGLTKAVLEHSNGLGWKSIYSRMQAINGTIDFLNVTTGFITQLDIPVE